MQTQHWSQIHVPLSQAFESYGMVESQGKLYMIGCLEEPPLGKSVCVMKLRNGAKLSWEEVDRMPSLLLEEFMKDGANADAYLRCIGHSELVLISMCGRNMPQLLYDVRKKVWRRLARCSVPDHRMVDGFSFEPRLDIKV